MCIRFRIRSRNTNTVNIDAIADRHCRHCVTADKRSIHKRYVGMCEPRGANGVTLGSRIVTDPEQALSFGQVASLYDSNRPTYPTEAAEWALGPAVGAGRGTVVDLGAGTGLLTRVLVPLAGEVIAVEPDPNMRTQLLASVPGVAALAGSAESMPLDDASVDSVVCGQAYHWFDKARAHPEIARVLRPGGSFGAVWNLRDGRVPWVQALGMAIGDAPDGHHRDPLRRLDIAFGPVFDAVEQAAFGHEVTMDADRLVALVTSRSMYIVADRETRARIEADVRALAATLPATFPMPYVTICCRATRR